jgi:hypothetical protein
MLLRLLLQKSKKSKKKDHFLSFRSQKVPEHAGFVKEKGARSRKEKPRVIGNPIKDKESVRLCKCATLELNLTKLVYYNIVN